MNARDLLAAAASRPWRWAEGGETTLWADEDQLIRYRQLLSPGRAVLNHAQTWPIRDSEADLIVAAVNEYEALVEVEASLRAVADFLAGPYRDHAKGALAHLDEIRGRA